MDRQPFPKNPTKAQLQEWSRQDTSFEQALAYPEDALGLLIEGYRIPVENARILRERERQSRPPVRKKRLARLVESWAGWWRGGQPEPVEEIDPLTVVLERTHEYMAIDGKGGGALSDDLTRYRGISEKDIREKSPRFLGYAYLMKQDGIWK